MNSGISGEVRVEWVALAELRRAPRNPKLHAGQEIERSIERFGYVAPLIMDERTGRLVAGHGRLDALEAIKKARKDAPARIKRRADGEWMVPVLRGVSFNSDAEAEAYLLADNRLTEAGGWDREMLADVLGGLLDHGEESLIGVGYTAEDARKLEEALETGVDGGPQPEDLLKTYLENPVKQVVLYFSGEEYDRVVTRLEKVRKHAKAADNTEAFLALLATWEAQP